MERGHRAPPGGGAVEIGRWRRGLQEGEFRKVGRVEAAVAGEETIGLKQSVGADEEVGDDVLARYDSTSAARAAEFVRFATGGAFDAGGPSLAIAVPARAGENERLASEPG